MSDQDERTMHQLVKHALHMVKSESISVVAHAFLDDLNRLGALLLQYEQRGEEYLHDTTTTKFTLDKLNRHPICVVYASRIAVLTGSEVGLRFERAWKWCEEVMAAGHLIPLPEDAS